MSAPEAAPARPRWRHALAAIPVAAALLDALASRSFHTWDAAAQDYVSITVFHSALRIALRIVTLGSPVLLLVLILRRHRLAPSGRLVALAAATSMTWGLCGATFGSGWNVVAQVEGRDGATYAVAGRRPFVGRREVRLLRRTATGPFATRFDVIPVAWFDGYGDPWPEGSRLVVEADRTIVVHGQETFRYTPPGR